MEQTDFVSLKDEWEDLDDLLTASLEDGETYNIECRGLSNALIQLATAKPTDMSGIMLDNNGQKVLTYTCASADKVYVRAMGDCSSLNITKTS